MLPLQEKILSNQTYGEEEQTQFEYVISIISQILLFFLVLGFAATVHPEDFKKSIYSKGTIICFTLQFLIMPFIGFLHIMVIPDLQDVFIVSLMIILSSPGGTYSNFFCALFNGDLSLSVAMTTVSTFLCIVTLPINLFFYLGFLLARRNEENVADLIEWGVLLQTVAIIISAIILGLLCNLKFPRSVSFFNAVGNICGASMILLGLTISNSDKPLWEQSIEVFFISFSPPLIAMFLAIFVSFKFGLGGPKMFAVAIEVCIQNSSIAMAFALAAFTGERQSNAIAIPVLYGISNALYGITFACIALKKGWTYTPQSTSLLNAFLQNHQPRMLQEEGKPLTRESTVITI